MGFSWNWGPNRSKRCHEGSKSPKSLVCLPLQNDVLLSATHDLKIKKQLAANQTLTSFTEVLQLSH